MPISISRLSGGNTPADGSDPRTFPAIWNATAAILEENVGTGGGGSITVSDTAPTDPAPANGDLWWKSDDGKLFVYYVDGDSSQWVDAAGPSVAVQSTAPTGYEGQLWLDDTDGSMYVYYTDPGGGASSWIGAVSRSGGILQVVSTAKTDIFSTTSTTAVDITGLTASITPRSTSSKIMVLVTIGAFSPEAGNTGNLQIARDGTALNISTGGATSNSGGLSVTSGATYGNHTESISYLDSPSSTSTLTYSAQVFAQSGSTLYVNRWVANDARRATSTITLMEVAG
jgi:hypothetical protein